MKICNFRPLCVLVLVVILEILISSVSLWLTLVLGAGLLLLALGLKMPKHFIVTGVVVYGLVALSFSLTTLFNSNPIYRTYDANAGLRGVVLRYADWYLHRFLSDDNAELVFSMLFGNKTDLPYLLRNNFSVAGMAHLLAVSGLHVGLLAVVLAYACKLCRVPRRYHLWVVLPILIFYAYLCGWQYAVLRAVIMYTVYSFAKNNLHLADNLSTLALAGIVILILFPYALFSISFLLSFACVLGIICWYQPIYKVIPVKMASMYLSVTIGSLPFMIYYFGGVTVYGILANVVLVPILVAIFYVGIFAVSTFALGAVLWLAEPILTWVCSVVNAMVKLPGALLPVTSGAFAIVIYLFAMIILSRFVLLKPKVKYWTAGALFACYFVLLVF